MHAAGRIAGAFALAAVLVVAGGIGLFRAAQPESPSEEPVPAVASAELTGALLAPGGNTTADLISQLQARLRATPGDARSFASLGIAYVQQARVTADPSYYPKAEEALHRSLQLGGGRNFEASVGMGTLAAARHDFSDALRWGERAVRINPDNVDAYGVVGDAQLELGRYPDAFATFQTMVDTKPTLSSYARVSYARELQGDARGAIEAMQASLRAAGTDADRAWASFQIGELEWNRGELDRARSNYRRALAMDPGFLPPLAGLARVAWANGDPDEALAKAEEVAQRYPSPEYVTLLGELYRAAGEPELAATQFELVETIQQLFGAGGVNVDLELSLFNADHGDPQVALRAARAEWAERRSVHVADAYAWALHADGRDAEAARYARSALRLGTGSALFRYHAAVIQLELGHRDQARALLAQALAANPNFSVLHAPIAERLSNQLGMPA